jgi:hypothetical protein
MQSGVRGAKRFMLILAGTAALSGTAVPVASDSVDRSRGVSRS